MGSNETFSTDFVDISEFFSGGGPSINEEEQESKSTFNEVDSPIKELKAIILSLDWEITDEIADSFIAEVDRLSDVWKSDKSVISFLQILRALGKYLRTHKADAHPESIKLLYSVYNNFEKIVLTNEITEEQEKHILKEELGKFHKLKEKIALAAAAASEGKANEHLLSALKTLLLEIDWQITDQTMQKFNIEINKLEQLWSTDRNFLTPLQMMRAIGSYINKNKRDSHPDSIKLLSTVFHHFEKMALSEDMSQEEQQELNQQDLERFEQLKKDILSVKASAVKPSPAFEIDEISAVPPQPDFPAQAYEGEEIGEGDDDFGYVEPISFGSDDAPQPPAGKSSISMALEGAEDEIDSRLSDLFFDDDTDLDTGEVASLPASVESEEVDGRLDDLFAESAGEHPSAVTPPPAAYDTVEVVPLPSRGDDDALFFDEEGAAAQEIEFDVPPVEPLPETPTRSDSRSFDHGASNTATLLEIVGESKSMAQINLRGLKEEIFSLQKICSTPNQKIILQILLSMVIYAEKAGPEAHPECLDIIRGSAHKLAECEVNDTGQSSDVSAAIEKSIENYIEFQNSKVFPALYDFAAKEKEIKKILGITS